MCHFRYTYFEGCGHFKRTRLSTCLASIQWQVQRPREGCDCKSCDRRRKNADQCRLAPACSAQHEGGDTIGLRIKGLCLQCHRDELLNQERKKRHIAFEESHNAIERLFNILGDKEPTATCKINQQFDEYGTIISTTTWFYVNNVLIHKITESGEGNMFAAFDANICFLNSWQANKEIYIRRAKFLDPKWTPQRASGSMAGLKEAYERWNETSHNALKAADDFRRVELEINAEKYRTEYLYNKQKQDRGTPTSIRCQLPYRAAVNPKPKSRLSNEVKLEDLLEKDRLAEFWKMGREQVGKWSRRSSMGWW